jgi:hypothetical protein
MLVKETNSKWYFSVPLWLIIVELLSYRQHTQIIVRTNVYIHYSKYYSNDSAINKHIAIHNTVCVLTVGK